METIISQNGNDTIIKISGRLDTIASTKFEQCIAPISGLANASIVVDCSELQYISSSGLRIFLSLQKNVAANNGIMVLKSLGSDIREIFDMTGFSSIFTIE
ncbi:MAG: STAS domain-containing protein [Muribaculaceae bacterium]